MSRLTDVWLASALSFLTPGDQPAGGAGDRPAETLARTPVLLWSVRLPGQPPAVATPTEPGAPTVYKNRLYLGYTGVNALLILDRTDGRVVEQLPARAPVASAPIVGDDSILFADSAGYTMAWKRGPDGWVKSWEHYSGAPIVQTPTIVDGTVFVSNVDELVFALDAESGDLRWRYQHRLDAGRSSALELFGAPAPTVEGDLVYTGFSDGFVAALDRKTGTELWTASVGEGTYPDLIAPALPLPAGGVIVGGYTKPLVYLDPATRSPSWRIEAGSAAPSILVDEVLYHPGADGKLRAIAARTGELKWTWDSGTTGPLAQPTLTSQGILVGSSDSTMFLVDVAFGTTRWKLDVGVDLTGFVSTAGVEGADIYALSNGGKLYALRGAAPVAKPGLPVFVTPVR